MANGNRLSTIFASREFIDWVTKIAMILSLAVVILKGNLSLDSQYIYVVCAIIIVASIYALRKKTERGTSVTILFGLTIFVGVVSYQIGFNRNISGAPYQYEMEMNQVKPGVMLAESAQRVDDFLYAQQIRLNASEPPKTYKYYILTKNSYKYKKISIGPLICFHLARIIGLVRLFLIKVKKIMFMQS